MSLISAQVQRSCVSFSTASLKLAGRLTVVDYFSSSSKLAKQLLNSLNDDEYPSIFHSPRVEFLDILNYSWFWSENVFSDIIHVLARDYGYEI